MPQSRPALTTIQRALQDGDQPAAAAAFLDLLAQPWSVLGIRQLDQRGELTELIPELEAARVCDQPNFHFLPVLAHLIETVAAADWMLNWINGGVIEPDGLPIAVQRQPDLPLYTVYLDEYRARFAEETSPGRPRAALFRLAALIHDVAKPQTKELKPDGSVSFYHHQTIGAEIAESIALRLGVTPEEARYVAHVVREHMRPGQLTELPEPSLRAIRRFFHATGDAGPDILLHSLADHLATTGPRFTLEGWLAHLAWNDQLLTFVWGEEIVPDPPLVNGDDLLQEFDLRPGPQIGELLAAIGEAQAEGEIQSRADGLALARQLLAERDRS